MRTLDFTVNVCGDPHGLRAVVVEGEDCPAVFLAPMALNYSIWPVDYLSLVLPLEEFLAKYCECYGLDEEEALGEIYDQAFLESCIEEVEDDLEAAEISLIGF